MSVSVFEVFIKNRIWKECVFQGIRRLRERFELNICIIIFYLPPTVRECVCMGGGGKSNFKIKKWYRAKNATPQAANKQKCLPRGRNVLTVMQQRSRMQHFNNDCKSSPCCVTDIYHFQRLYAHGSCIQMLLVSFAQYGTQSSKIACGNWEKYSKPHFDTRSSDLEAYCSSNRCENLQCLHAPQILCKNRSGNLLDMTFYSTLFDLCELRAMPSIMVENIKMKYKNNCDNCQLLGEAYSV